MFVVFFRYKPCFTEEICSSKMFYILSATSLPTFPPHLNGHMPLKNSKIFCPCCLTCCRESESINSISDREWLIKVLLFIDDHALTGFLFRVFLVDVNKSTGTVDLLKCSLNWSSILMWSVTKRWTLTKPKLDSQILRANKKDMAKWFKIHEIMFDDF